MPRNAHLLYVLAIRKKVENLFGMGDEHDFFKLARMVRHKTVYGRGSDPSGA